MLRLLVVAVAVACARAEAVRGAHGARGDGERLRSDLPTVPYPYPQHGVVSHSHPHEVARQNEILRETLSPVHYQPELILDYRYLKTGRHAVQGPGGQYILLPRGSTGEQDGVLYDSLLEDHRPRVHRPDPHPIAEHIIPGTHEARPHEAHNRPRHEPHRSEPHRLEPHRPEPHRPEHEIHERPVLIRPVPIHHSRGHVPVQQGHGRVPHQPSPLPEHQPRHERPAYQGQGHGQGHILSTHAPEGLRGEHRQEYQEYGWLQQGIVQ